MRTEAERTATLEREVRRALGDGGIRVLPWREGVDYFADLARRRDGGIVGVVRSPATKSCRPPTRGRSTSPTSSPKEVNVLGLLCEAGVPAPSVLAWRRRGGSQGVSWMLCEHVDHRPTDELNEDQQHELGRITRAIHSIRPGTTVGRPQESWRSYVLGRVADRLRAAERYCPRLPVETLLSRCAAGVPNGAGQADVLLHLDLRPPNLCVRGGRITAVIDVANAITGDPWLELARIRFCGLFTEPFRTGYGIGDADVGRRERLLDLYELDIAALMVVVAAEETNDEELLKSSRDRLEHLCARIIR